MTAADETDLLRTIDAVVENPVLVFGSLPPAGRDLDLLALPRDAEAIARRLSEEGFLPWGRGWVAFRGCSAQAVELIPPAKLRLPDDELRQLFAEGTAIAPTTKIVEPAAHHTLLIAARRLARDRTQLAPKQRARIARAATREPAAWERARSKAEVWGAQSALARLEAAYRSEEAPGRSWSSSPLRRPRRTRVLRVAAVAPDEATAHAETLARTLERLGFAAVLVRPNARAYTPPRSSREALAVALALWRPFWRHLGRATVLVYDRSAIDAAAPILAERSTPASVPPAVTVLRLASPRALRSYVLGADGPVADNGYRAASRAFGARPLDLSRGREELCAEIAEDAWRALARRTLVGIVLRRVASTARRGREP
jgi:hypothetical protein